VQTLQEVGIRLFVDFLDAANSLLELLFSFLLALDLPFLPLLRFFVKPGELVWSFPIIKEPAPAATAVEHLFQLRTLNLGSPGCRRS